MEPPRRTLARALPRAAAVALCLAATLGQPPEALARSEWTGTGQMATGRAEHTATLLASGKVLVAGGRVGPATSTASAETFDPAGETWSPAGTMPSPRAFHTATRLADNRVLVVAGLGAASPVPGVDLFNPAAGPAGAWAAGPPLGAARSHHAAALLADGRVLVTGGYGADGNPTASVEIFDPAANGGAGAWTGGPPLSQARAQHTATPLPGGRVLVANGTTCNAAPPAGCPTASAEVFDPAANGGAGGWTSAPALGLRFDHVAVALPSGDVLVAGGVDGTGALRRSAEVFHPDGTWSEGNPMRIARTNFAGALLPDGRVLVTGGGTGVSVDEASSEIWRPSPVGWSDAAAMTGPRRGHTLTTLAGPGCGVNCGKLLVAGGVRNFPGDPLRSAELYGAVPVVYPLPPPAGTPPGAVRDLRASALSTSRVRLSFSAPGNPPARSYVVKQARSRITGAETFARARSLCGGTCRFSPRTAGERLTLTVDGLRPGTTYYYALRAVGADGRAYPTSNVAVVKTRSRRPGRVRGLRVRALSATRVRVRFRATGAPPARRYVVKQARSRIRSARSFRRARSLCRGLCRFRVDAEGSRVELLVTGLRPATRYCYAVRARYGRRLAPRSTSVCTRTARRR